MIFYYLMAQSPSVCLGLIFILRLQDHTKIDTQQSVGLHWASDHPDAETSTWQHTTNPRHTHSFCFIYTFCWPCIM